MDEKLLIHVNITGGDDVSCGSEKYALVRFEGYADGDLFTGKILAGGADCQHFYDESGAPAGTLSARYILEGTDFGGNKCRIFIENNADISAGYTVPKLFTDSPALKGFAAAELRGRIINGNGGLTIEIAKKNSAEFEITAITCGDSLRDDVIRFAEGCSWRGGQHLAEMMKNGQFHDWERIFIARTSDGIAGFCTLTERDEMPAESGFSPFIGSVFVDERYRGNRLSEKMIRKAQEYAREIGFEKVYIMSGEEGLYEKYGFTPLGYYKTIFGSTDRLLAADVSGKGNG